MNRPEQWKQECEHDWVTLVDMPGSAKVRWCKVCGTADLGHSLFTPSDHALAQQAEALGSLVGELMEPGSPLYWAGATVSDEAYRSLTTQADDWLRRAEELRGQPADA